MAKYLSVVAIFALCVSPAFGSVQINFSDDDISLDPGFRITNVDGIGISEKLELGSDFGLNAADGLDYMRISGATSSDMGLTVANFIVVIPELRIVSQIGPPVGGITLYNLEIFTGGFSSIATFGNTAGFRVYASVADVFANSPLMIADVNLLDPFLVVGSAGVVEASVSFVNLTNVRLSPAGTLHPTLVEFSAAANVGGGADMNVNVSAAGQNIANRINAGQTVAGSSSGSVLAVPEPGTLMLLAAGAMLTLRRRKGRHAA